MDRNFCECDCANRRRFDSRHLKHVCQVNYTLHYHPRILLLPSSLFALKTSQSYLASTLEDRTSVHCAMHKQETTLLILGWIDDNKII